MNAFARLLVVMMLALFCCLLATCSRAQQKHEESEVSLFSMRERELEKVRTGGVAQPTDSTGTTEELTTETAHEAEVPVSPAPSPPVATPARPAATVNADTSSRNDALLAGLTIFVLAIFVGFEVITKVPPTLHTPLMSGSNAISGITIVGAVIVAGVGFKFSAFVGMIAVILATVNVVGGFLVTHRMLSMFKRR